MPDVFTRKKRSAVMARIRGSGNLTTEMRMISLMREHGIRGWRRNIRLPGRPDFVFRTERIAVFVDGCFWHGCPEHYTEPASSAEFWRTKIAVNRRRDRRVDRQLRAAGWRVVRLWEHDLRRRASAAMMVRFQRVLARAAAASDTLRASAKPKRPRQSHQDAAATRLSSR